MERPASFLDTSQYHKGELPIINDPQQFNLLINRLVVKFELQELIYKTKKREKKNKNAIYIEKNKKMALV